MIMHSAFLGAVLLLLAACSVDAEEQARAWLATVPVGVTATKSSAAPVQVHVFETAGEALQTQLATPAVSLLGPFDPQRLTEVRPADEQGDSILSSLSLVAVFQQGERAAALVRMAGRHQLLGVGERLGASRLRVLAIEPTGLLLADGRARHYLDLYGAGR